ncbi:uncharacterized protein LOC108813469 isoform X2 [Raphanus sativus]|uniref:Uncharacterized protein LOC108813469 isoform X2 n=1 Tax=Raphanus sativus TaxID=3726 RepID=A0A9W3C120_RAPSA|nr:uncharacterized protein LOC108813469 isoform X2 [Raphanus sativus]
MIPVKLRKKVTRRGKTLVFIFSSKVESMAGGTGTSMLGSILLFTVILSLQEVYRGKLASTELLTIFGGFTSSLLFLFSLTFIGNLQESSGVKSGWGAEYGRPTY